MLNRARQYLADRLAPATRDRPAAPQQRSVDGATATRRGDAFGVFHSYAGEVAAAATRVRARARFLATSDAWTNNAVANLCGDLVGAGIRPAPQDVDAGTAAELSDAWRDWQGRIADYERRAPLTALLRLLTRHLIVDGEGLAVMYDTPDAGLQVQVLPPERLDYSKVELRRDGTRILHGVEMDAAGRRTGYWLLPNDDSVLSFGASPSVRVDARDCLHLYDPLGAGQHRGLSALAAAIVPANDLNDLVDSMRIAAKISSLLAGFVKDAADIGSGSSVLNPDAEMVQGFEPGQLVRLPAGVDVTFSNPQANASLPQYLRGNLLQLAAAIGVPEHYVSGDLSGANYSSIRAGLLNHRQRVAQTQTDVLIPALDRIWSRWQILEFAAGRVSVGTVRANWIPPRVHQVDPAKAVAAEKTELELGLTSRAAAVAARGRDVRELDDEIRRSGDSND